MPRRPALLLLSLLSAPAWAGLDYDVRLDAPSELAALLSENLELISGKAEPDMDAPQLEALLKSAPEDVQKLLETEGYFNAHTRVEKLGENRYALIVTPGEASLVSDVTVRLVGAIRQEPDFSQRFGKVLEAWSLPLAAPYKQSDWDASKRAALRSLAADRFPLAKITHSRARIDPAHHSVELEVELDSGPRIAFGDICVKGLQRYPEAVATGKADFSPGSPYQQQKLLDFQAALEQSPHFNSVIVSADMAAIADQRVPVEVELSEFPRQKLELGLSYDSVDGVGGRIGYDHYNIFRRGYTGSALLTAKKNEQSLSLGLAVPRGSDGYSHSATSMYKASDLNGVKSRELSAGAWRIRARGNIEARLGFEYLDTRARLDGTDIQADNHALLASFGWTQRAVDSAMQPRSGYLIDSKLSATLGQALSSTRLTRAYARGSQYWTPFPGKGTLLARLEAGQIWAKDGQAVPDSLLFRAGGINSVRGYNYQSLGVNDPDATFLGQPVPAGTVLGGQVLATATLEYQFPVARDWALALFTDAGNAASRWSEFHAERSNGLGVRWNTPVAPLSFDFAKAQRDGRWRWYLSLGLAF